MGKHNKPGIKADFVLEFLDKFPEATTNSLARMLLDQHPLYFDTFEGARSLVRYYRDELLTKYPPSDIRSKRTAEMKRDAMSQFALPKSKYKELRVFHLPRSSNRGLIMSDIHIPYQDNDALGITLEFGDKFKPNFIYLNGDVMDIYQLSDFSKDRRLPDMKKELELTRDFLAMLQERYKCPVYYKFGNHEERWERFLRKKAPELLGIKEMELSVLLRFAENGVHEIKSRQKAFLGKLPLYHGHEFGKTTYNAVNPARGLFLKIKQTGAVSHHHMVSSHPAKNAKGQYIMTWSIGCLCGLSPEFSPNNDWMHGFATIEIQPSGTFHFTNHYIMEGVLH